MFHALYFRFSIVGYGCMTCIGNSGPLPEPVGQAIDKVCYDGVGFVTEEGRKLLYRDVKIV